MGKRGPKAGPVAKRKRRCVLVKLDDGQYATLKRMAAPQPLATYMREKALAS